MQSKTELVTDCLCFSPSPYRLLLIDAMQCPVSTYGMPLPCSEVAVGYLVQTHAPGIVRGTCHIRYSTRLANVTISICYPVFAIQYSGLTSTAGLPGDMENWLILALTVSGVMGSCQLSAYALTMGCPVLT